MTTPHQPDRPAWAARRERGSVLALRLVALILRHTGRRASGLLLYPIAGYFWLFPGPARAASQQYLARLRRFLGPSQAPPPRRFETYWHILAFARSILDRFFFWMGRSDAFQVTVHDLAGTQQLLDAGRGVVLLGAHLGSFDVLRVMARDAGIRVNVVMYTENAQRINDLMKELDSESQLQVIQIDPHSIRSVFEIRRCVERGELVAVLGDRVVPGGRSRVRRASFLGETAPFPEGPFLLPLLLGAPVVMCLALRRGAQRYELFLERLPSSAAVETANRDKRVQEQVEAFAARLEHYCALEPYQWFNFHDFWRDAR